MKTLQELKEWYHKVNCSGDEFEQLEFVWEIMKSPHTEYHYSVATDKNTAEYFRGELWTRFDEHREEGAKLLLSKLDNNEDADVQAEMIFCLGKIADEQKIEKERTLAFVRKFANAENDFLRDRAIIVLGWIGEIKDIALIGNHLLNDTNAKCRAWAASSFMQMSFRRKSKSLAEKALSYLKQAITQETDYFVLGVIIEAVSSLTGKKFGLPRYAIDNLDKEKIDIAKVKVERLLSKS
jgi:hypothetical protein